MTLSPRRAASYRLSLRLLLSPARLRESLTTLQPQPSLRNATIAGAQVALALVLIAAALHPSPWQHVLGFACLGALAALFGRCATVAQRRRIVLIAGALLLGPVAVLLRGDGDEALLRLANDSEFGLSAAIFSRDTGRALALAQRVESGICHINGPTVHDEAQMPFGGVKASGYGRFGGKAGIDAFTELRWITVQTAPRHYPF